MAHLEGLRPKVGVGVFVTHSKRPGCVLLGERLGSAGHGTYALPGGHLEFGESWEECACREVLEETGLQLTDVQYIGVVNAIDLPTKYHYIVIFMQGHLVDEEQTVQTCEPEKCRGWSWYNWHNFPQPLFHPLELFRKQGQHPIDIQ